MRLYKLHEFIKLDDNDDKLKRKDPYLSYKDAPENPFCIIPGTRKGSYINTLFKILNRFFPVTTYLFSVLVKKQFQTL